MSGASPTLETAFRQVGRSCVGLARSCTPALTVVSGTQLHILLDPSNSPVGEVGHSPYLWVQKLRPGELNDFQVIVVEWFLRNGD